MQAKEGPANERCRGCSLSGYRPEWRVPVFCHKAVRRPPSCDRRQELQGLCSRVVVFSLVPTQSTLPNGCCGVDAPPLVVGPAPPSRAGGFPPVARRASACLRDARMAATVEIWTAGAAMESGTGTVGLGPREGRRHRDAPAHAVHAMSTSPRSSGWP